MSESAKEDKSAIEDKVDFGRKVEIEDPDSPEENIKVTLIEDEDLAKAFWKEEVKDEIIKEEIKTEYVEEEIEKEEKNTNEENEDKDSEDDKDKSRNRKNVEEDLEDLLKEITERCNRPGGLKLKNIKFYLIRLQKIEMRNDGQNRQVNEDIDECHARLQYMVDMVTDGSLDYVVLGDGLTTQETVSDSSEEDAEEPTKEKETEEPGKKNEG